MKFDFSEKYIEKFVGDKVADIRVEAEAAFKTVMSGSGKGSDFLGWRELPLNYDKVEYARIKKAAEKIRNSCDVFVVIGIGGSYLGARAAIEFVHGNYYNEKAKKTPSIYFVGNDISSSKLRDILTLCEGKDICINVISKSGTTTEPAIAFRIFRELLYKKYGDAAKERIFVTTDAVRGALKEQANEIGYEAFVVPDDIGGRYSVLSAVGLLPIAVSGADTDAMLAGAEKARVAFSSPEYNKNAAMRYAANRNLMLRNGKSVEILAVNDPALTLTCEWWKQLYGESEGKDGKALYPSSVVFTTDLHSLGQYIQQGTRNIFETFINLNSEDDFAVPFDDENKDKMNFIAGKTMSYVNQKAFAGTVMAHVDGGVPNNIITIESRDEETFGYIVYFFELACAISGYILGVNPFDQPGVEAYKKNMFALLDKPGYADLKNELEKKLNN